MNHFLNPFDTIEPGSYHQDLQNILKSKITASNPYIQTKRVILNIRSAPSDSSPIRFLIYNFEIHEGVSQLLEAKIHAVPFLENEKRSSDFVFEKLLFKEAFISLENINTDEKKSPEELKALPSGIITHISTESGVNDFGTTTQLGTFSSSLVFHLSSPLCLLKYNNNYRSFVNKSAHEIIKDVLEKYKVEYVNVFDYQLSQSAKSDSPVRQNCIQFGESDYDFFCRLLEEEGWTYFNLNQTDKSKPLAILMVVENLEMNFKKKEKLALKYNLSNYNLSNINDAAFFSYDFKGYSIDKFTTFASDVRRCVKVNDTNTSVTESLAGVKNKNSWEVGELSYQIEEKEFEKNGFTKPLERKAKTLLSELSSQSEFVKFVSPNFDNQLGSTFKFELPNNKFIDNEVTIYDTKDEYTVFKISHFYKKELSLKNNSATYWNQNHCYRSSGKKKVNFRLPISYKLPELGFMTAVIYKDASDKSQFIDSTMKFKVQFRWPGEEAQKMFAYARYVQPWAQGFHFFPKPGDEVMIGFENQNPDKPFIMGSLYTSENTTPYEHAPSIHALSDKTLAVQGLMFKSKENKKTIIDQASPVKNSKIHTGIKFLQTKDNEILEVQGDVIICDGPEKILIHSNESTITIENNIIEIKTGKSTMTMKKEESTLVVGESKMNFKASGEIEINSKSFVLKSDKIENTSKSLKVNSDTIENSSKSLKVDSDSIENTAKMMKVDSKMIELKHTMGKMTLA